MGDLTIAITANWEIYESVAQNMEKEDTPRKLYLDICENKVIKFEDHYLETERRAHKCPPKYVIIEKLHADQTAWKTLLEGGDEKTLETKVEKICHDEGGLEDKDQE